VIVPVVFLLAMGSLVHWSLAALPALASAYGFAQVDAKTEDDFFLGWPSYWNVVALYAWLLELSPVTTTIWVVVLSALIFVPLKYIYPSKLRVLRTLTAVTGTLWVAGMAVIASLPAGPARTNAAIVSLAYLVYYVALSAWLGRWWEVARGARS
jgi:phosphatidylcholine synthase